MLRLLVLLLVAAGAAQAASFLRYSNDRFGVSADVPSDWRAQPPPDNNDGRTFLSPDGRGRILVFGSLHSADTIDEELDLRGGQPGETVTYSARGPRWVTASGLKGETIFYRRSMLGCRDQVWAHLVIEYPRADKAAYDPIVARVSRTLRGGQGWQVKCR